MGKISLDPWQEEVLAHQGDILLCTGRRVGKTYILARKAVDRMAKNPKTPIVIVSLTEDQAMIIMSMALNYAKDNYPALIGKGRFKPTLRSMHINGGKMVVRPVGSTGDGARGFEGGVLIVDEASRMPKMFWTAAKPILLTTNGELWMGSTPFGKQGYFWERFDEAYNKKMPDARFKVFYISTEQVIQERPISETWTEDQRAGALRILKEDKFEMSRLEYGQEYLGLFLDELNQFFDDDLIEKACVLEKDPKRLGKRYLGVDIGRRYDPSAFEDIAVNDKKFYHCDSQTTKDTFTNQTQDKIVEMENAVKYRAIGIDAGSGALGVGVYDNLMTIAGIKRKLQAMNNRTFALDRDGKKTQRLMKEDYYNNLKAMMENGSLKLLRDDAVIASLKSVQWEITKENDEEKGIKSKIRIFGNDTHIAEALARAAYLANKDKGLNIWVR